MKVIKQIYIYFKKAIGKLHNYLSKIVSGQKVNKAQILEHTFNEGKEMHLEQLTRNDLLQKKLKFLNKILFQRSRSTWETQFVNGIHLQGFITGHNPYRINVIVDNPAKQIEIATIYTRSYDETLIIEYIKLNFRQCDAHIMQLILKELSIRVETLGFMGA